MLNERRNLLRPTPISSTINFIQHDSNGDEHWAERQFIDRVFVPLCGLYGLRYLKPQVPFEDSQGIRRRIDFVLEGERRYALEIEGETHQWRTRREARRLTARKPANRN